MPEWTVLQENSSGHYFEVRPIHSFEVREPLRSQIRIFEIRYTKPILNTARGGTWTHIRIRDIRDKKPILDTASGEPEHRYGWYMTPNPYWIQHVATLKHRYEGYVTPTNTKTASGDTQTQIRILGIRKLGIRDTDTKPILNTARGDQSCSANHFQINPA